MRWYIPFAIGALIASTWFSYLMASLGAPQQLWFWRDILGVL